MGDQLTMFEPQGAEVLQLARKHEKDAASAFDLAAVYDVRGFGALACNLYKLAHASERQAVELTMLAEFEALAGLSA
jgi:hypothetical protein